MSRQKDRSRLRVRPLLVLVLVVGACSGAEVSAPETTTTTTTTTTSTTTTTTTTTTLPPGLQPTVLAYGWADSTMAVYDSSLTVTMDVEVDGGEAEDSVITTLMEGRTKILAVAAADSGHEVIADFLLDEGYVEVASDGASFRQDLTVDDRHEFRDSVAGVTVLDSRGVVRDGHGGTPGNQVPATALERLTAFGPPLSTDPVDVGDEWAATVESSEFGDLAVDVAIVEEIEDENGDYMFVVEYTAHAVDPPGELGLDELVDEVSYLGQLGAYLRGADDATFRFHEIQLTGRGTFDPARGVMVSLETSADFGVDTEIQVAGEVFSGANMFRLENTHSLVEFGKALSFDMAAIFRRFETDPFDLAFERLGVLPFYLEMPNEERRDVVFDELMIYSFAIAGYSMAEVTAAGGEATVTVIANGGEFRGIPLLARDLGYVISGSTPRRTTVSDQDAWRFTTAGHEWLMWNDDQFTYAILGDRELAAAIMESFVTATPPALWSEGDCLTFSDDGGELPFSPFGDYGLVHCAQSHEYEVLYTTRLPEGPDAEFPEDIWERLAQVCGERFFDHTGGYPMTSELGMVTYQPDPDEWDKGARYLACVIYQDTEDGPASVRTRFDGAAEANPVELAVGVCLSEQLPVDCRDAHDVEVIVVDEFEAPEDAAFPNGRETWEEYNEVCSSALDEYGATDGPAELDAYFATDMYYGWDRGLRTYYCFAYAAAEDTSVPILGSVTGNWELAPDQVDT